jgi:hypothetical protein
MNNIVKFDNNFFNQLTEADKGNKDSQLYIRKTLQAYLFEPKIIQRNIQRKIQALGPTVSTDLPLMARDAFTITIAEDNFDLGWQAAFQNIPLGQYEDSWEIFDVDSALQFVKMNEGQKLEVAGFTGSKVTAYVDYYGGAIGRTDKVMRFRKLYAYIDAARRFRNNFFTTQADIFYALIAAAGAFNVTAYDGGADGQLRRDMRTINSAILTLTDRCKDKGIGNTANIPLVMYANPFDRARIEAAFTATTNPMSATESAATELSKTNPIQRIYTFNQFVVAGSPIVGIPGNKNQRSEALAPTTFKGELDVLTLNVHEAVWAIFGGVIADTDQWQQLTLS